MSAFVPLSLDDLDAQGYDTVIVCAPDMAGRLIGKRLSPRKFAEFHERGVAVSSCTFGWGISQDIGLEVPYTGWHTGWRDFLLVADLATLRPAACSALGKVNCEPSKRCHMVTPLRWLCLPVSTLARLGAQIELAQ